MNTQPRSTFEKQGQEEVKIDQFDFTDMQDIVRESTSIENLKLGDIIDAQDYLGDWYLAIIIDEVSATSKQVHFLPY